MTLSLAKGPGFIPDPAATNATLNIVDDDVQVVTVIASDPVATERDLSVPGTAPDTATFLITRAGDLTEPLTVYYAVSGLNTGSAANALHGVDYEPLPGVLVIPAGQANGAVTIVPLWDGLGEGPENVSLQLGAGSTQYRLGVPYSASITINDAGDPPYVDVVTIDNAVEEAPRAHFRITARSTGISNLVVHYTLSGTASSGSDFSPLSGSVTLPNSGISTVDISVTPINDSLAEDIETLTLTLTPNVKYRLFEPTASATMWLIDNEQPTVFVDAHQTSYPPSISENGGRAAFYLSRSGTTTAALTVNFSLGGTALNGADYQFLSGTTNIPAGQPGVEVPVVAINDSLVEGTETITLNLEPGSYARGPAATLYLSDDENAAVVVGFPTSATTQAESVTPVMIPVSLSATSASPVTVEYLVDSGSRSSYTTNGAGLSALPYWVRCDRLGNTLVGSISPDGLNWTGLSTQTVAMASGSYQVGLYVCSYNTSLLSTGVFDSILITNLQPGGSLGARGATNIGNPSISGGVVSTDPVYTVAGAGDNVDGTTDQGFFTWWPVSNSSTCSIVARILSQQAGAAGATAGVMIRESSANNARRGYVAATPGSGFEFHYRTNTAATEAKSSLILPIPLWVRLQRTAGSVQAFQSSDGTTWKTVGTNLDLAFGPEVFLGLGVSARAEGKIAAALFDSVSLSPGPLPWLEGRTIGLSAIQGSHLQTEGSYSLSASGDGFTGTSDEAYCLGATVTGDFVFTARIRSLEGDASTPQAGLCVRDSSGAAVRSVYVGGKPGAAPQLVWRPTTLTLANGQGIDFNLAPGVLVFPPGVTTQYLALQLVNDARPEPDEPVTVLLRNAQGARLGNTLFTTLIVDDDSASALPFVGFAAPASSTLESDGAVRVPVTLSRPATTNLSVDYFITAGSALAGVDFEAADGSLVFQPGDSVRTIPVRLLDDALVEPNETLYLTLMPTAGLLTNSVGRHLLSIVDDDLPTISISSTDTNAAEAGDSAVVTLSRSGPTNNALTINLGRAGTATAGTDYTGINSTAVVPAGETSVSLTFNATQDAILENTETAIITVAAGAGYAVGTPATVTLFIDDDDRNTVSLSVVQPTAIEGGASASLLLSRSGNTNASLTVTLSLSGTATNGTDYTTSPSPLNSVVLGAGQSARLLYIQPINDSLTEGDEVVLVQIASGSYDIGEPGYASVTIRDNDLPPTVFIHSPGAQGVVLAPRNGVQFAADAADDGAPQPLHYAWSALSGPAPVNFENPTEAATPATFGATGNYLIRVAVSDGQFTNSDQIFVTVGVSTNLVPADWISTSIGPPTLRGFSGPSGSNWMISATGTGFTGTSDYAQALSRQVNGTASLVVRLLTLSNAPGLTGAEAGLTLRDSMHRGARRAALLYQSATRTLRFRPRVTNSTADFALSRASLDLPLWLRLDRNAETNSVAAFFASDNNGTPGPWVQLGTNVVIAMDASADVSLVSHSGSDSAAAGAVFDQLSLDPTPTGPAIIVEDFGDGTQAGVYSYNPAGDIHTLAGDGSLDGSGLFWGQQFVGDFILTALQIDASSSGNDSRSGIMIRDSFDNGAMAFVGRNPVSSFSSFVWRTNPKGSTSGLSGITQKKRWLRLIRNGNKITALHAPDNSGAPGAWTQVGQPQTVFLQPVVVAGLYCDNAGGVGLNTATFTKLTAVPLHKAPVVDTGPAPAHVTATFALSAHVVDDGLPAPFSTAWSTLLAPQPVTWADSNSLTSSLTLTGYGDYTLRLWADDTLAQSFQDLSFSFNPAPFEVWQTAHFAEGAASPDAAPEADPDGDGLNNAGEYALGTNPNQAQPLPLVMQVVDIDSVQFVRVTIPRNPAATDLTLRLEASDTLLPAVWTTSGIVVEEDSPTCLQVRHNVPLPQAAGWFLRLQAILNPLP